MTASAPQGFRLSPQQRRLWTLQQGHGPGPYVSQCAVLIEGPLDEAALRSAFRAVAARHEILCTAFQLLPGVKLPVQVILDAPAPPSWRIPASAEPGSDPLDTLLDAFLQCPSGPDFGLESGVSPQLELLPVCPGQWLLLLRLPALCADGTSLRNLIIELAAASAPDGGGTPSPEGTQFADIAEWQNQLLEGEEAREGAAYWRRHVRGGDRPRMHFEREAEGEEAFRPAHLRLQAGPPLAALVDAAARDQGVSPATWLQGCWQILLWRLSGSAELLLGHAREGRAYDELANSVGPLSRYLPLRVGLSPERPLRAVLASLGEELEQAERWQDYFSWEACGCAGSDGQPPFLPLCFEYARGGTWTPAGGPSFSLLTQSTCIDRHLLKLSCFQTPSALELRLDYDAARCAATGVARLAEQLTRLMRDAAQHPDAPIGSLELLEGTEYQQVVRGFNGKESPVPPTLLHELFEAQAARMPDRVALVTEQGSVSYGELDARANQLAARLRGLGVKPETRVGLYLERSTEMVVAMLGTLKAGGAYVPLDPEYPVARIAYILRDSAAPVVLTSRALAGQLPLEEVPAERRPRVVCVDAGQSPAPLPDSGWSPAAWSDSPAYVLYTSGSTGWPKGVVVCHRQVVNHMLWMQHAYPLTPEDGVLQKTPISFDASVWELYAPLLVGARLVLARPGGHKDPAYLIPCLLESEVSILQVVPTLLRWLLDSPAFATCRSLRRVFCGGEVLTPELQRRFSATLDAELINLYGPTETTIEVTSWRCGTPVAPGPAQLPIGQPITNVRPHVLDARLRPQPIGVRGELYIAGAALARGYENRPDLTAERFLPDPFRLEPGARMYRTGDLASWREDGTLDFFGRVDHQIKLRGLRVELGEIEALATQHAAVPQAVAVVHKSEDGHEQLLCYFTVRPGATVDVTELRALLALRLPESLVPSRLIPLTELPLTPNGKVDRAALSERKPSSETHAGTVPPRDPMELRLVHIWERVLKVRPIGVTDSFFSVGGHSLLAVSVMAEIQREFGHELPLAAFFQAPTVEAQARLLREGAPALLRSPLVTIQAGNGARPLFFIHPTGGNVLCYLELVRHLGPELPVHALQDPGLYQDEPAYGNLEEMAALYVETIRQVQAEGPYCLGGWSSGGVVAFEVAQQLRLQGQDVALLAMLDSQAPHKEETTPDDARLLASIARLLHYQAGQDASTVSPEAFGQTAREEDFQRLLHLAQATGFLPPGVELPQIYRLFNVFRSNVHVVERYEPRGRARRITLFRATEPLPDSIRQDAVRHTATSRTHGWEQLGEVEVHDVPGNHLNMVTRPHVQVLAQCLRQALEKCGTTS